MEKRHHDPQAHESKRMYLTRNSQGMKKEEESHELTSARVADLMVLIVYLTCLIKSFGSLVCVKCYQMQNLQQDEKYNNKLRRHIKLFEISMEKMGREGGE